MHLPVSTTSMFPSRALRRAVMIALYGATTIPAAFAQTAPTAPKKDEPTVVETITVVGSRRVNASSTDTTVPVDFIPMTKVA